LNNKHYGREVINVIKLKMDEELIFSELNEITGVASHEWHLFSQVKINKPNISSAEIICYLQKNELIFNFDNTLTVFSRLIMPKLPN